MRPEALDCRAPPPQQSPQRTNRACPGRGPRAGRPACPPARDGQLSAEAAGWGPAQKPVLAVGRPPRTCCSPRSAAESTPHWPTQTPTPGGRSRPPVKRAPNLHGSPIRRGWNLSRRRRTAVLSARPQPPAPAPHHHPGGSAVPLGLLTLTGFDRHRLLICGGHLGDVIEGGGVLPRWEGRSGALSSRPGWGRPTRDSARPAAPGFTALLLLSSPTASRPPGPGLGLQSERPRGDGSPASHHWARLEGTRTMKGDEDGTCLTAQPGGARER